MNDIDIKYMNEALKEAKVAYKKGEIPIGAVLVIDDEIVSRNHNQKEATKNPTSHAEINVIIEACKKLDRYILDDATLYVTIEPCMMCVGAILQTRIKRVVYGASQPKFGSVSSVVNLLDDNNFNHETTVTKGTLEAEASKLMKDFFRELR